MDKNNAPKIAVIGAGVVGMTTAKILQERLRNLDITVIADKFKDDTLSAVAVGIFRPGTSFAGPTPEITSKWVTDSWYYWEDIRKTSEGNSAGVTSISSYIFSKENYYVTRNHLLEGLVPVYRAVDDDELKLCGKGWKYGSFFTTLKIGCEDHLPWLEKQFVNNGGKILNEKIDSFISLKHFDIVFNCTGLGAKYLCNDHSLVPLRGQIIRVKAPWLKTAFYGDYDAYVIPSPKGVATLGGTRQYDSYNLNVCKHDAAGIMDRCSELLPALKKAEVVAHKVGLRPHRVPVRVEPELLNGLKVIHCYGHGGYGITCAPGTVIQAVDIGLDLLRSNLKTKL